MKLREVMRKVIYFSTMGVDMSKLYPNVVMVSITKDIVVKKMTNQCDFSRHIPLFYSNDV